MLMKKFLDLLYIGFLFHFTKSEKEFETFCNINGKRAIQHVSDKFLSITIDPGILVNGLNSSCTSLKLAKHLSPAYVRIAGPSTKYVKYVENKDKIDGDLSENRNNIIVTPSMWLGINGWLNSANLTPVFGINDVETSKGVWNPEYALPLLEISDKLNVSCLWQLGFDSTRRSELQYKQDLNAFKNILAKFPDRDATWKIIGSDISHIPAEHTETAMQELKDVVTAVMWEPFVISDETFSEKTMPFKIFSNHETPVKLWTTVPKSSSESFSSVFLWATQLGNAAKAGFDVIFRRATLDELCMDTPVYWFSLLHKKLMGSNVLDAKTTTFSPGSSVYAHCTRKQNSSPRGALTVMIVNSKLEKYRVKVKLGTTSIESTIEIQSYILTSKGENHTETLLNGRKLSSDLLAEKNLLKPKLKRLLSKPFISLEVPPFSIGFFVIPKARIPACYSHEISQEMTGHHLQLFRETDSSSDLKIPFVRNSELEDKQMMKREMQSQEKFYKIESKLKSRLETLKNRAKSDIVEDKINIMPNKLNKEKQNKRTGFERKKEELKKILFEKPKLSEAYKHKNRNELKSNLKYLDLTSQEIERILKDRVRVKAAKKNIRFTDEELSALVQAARRRFSRSVLKKPNYEENSRKRRDINMHMLERHFWDTSTNYPKRDYHDPIFGNRNLSKNKIKRSSLNTRDLNSKLLGLRSKLEDNRRTMENRKYEIFDNSQTKKESIKERIQKIKNGNRFKRDINMDLLETKTEGQNKILPKGVKKFKSAFNDKRDKAATIRQPGESSPEFLIESEQSLEKNLAPKTEIFAELAEYEDESEEYSEPATPIKPKIMSVFNKNNKLNLFSILNPPEEKKPKPRKLKKNKNESGEDLQFLTSSEEFPSIEDDLPCIHEFFGNIKGSVTNTKYVNELGEGLSSEENLKKKKANNRKMVEFEGFSFSGEDYSSEDFRKKRDDGDGDLKTENLKGERLADNNSPYDEQEETDSLRLKRDLDIHIQDKLHKLRSRNGFKKGKLITERRGEVAEIIVTDENDAVKLLPNDNNRTNNNKLRKFSSLKNLKKKSEKNKGEENTVTLHQKGNDDVDHKDTIIGQSAPDVIQSEHTKSVNENLNEPNKNMLKGESELTTKNLNNDKTSKAVERIKTQDLNNSEEDNGKAQGLKDLKHESSTDRLQHKQEKKQKKTKFLSKKKDENKDDILGEIREIEKEKQKEILQSLHLLREKITQRKEEIDKLLLKDTKANEKTDNKQSLKRNKEKLQRKRKFDENKIDEEVKQNDGSSAIKIAKRSILDPSYDFFGKYKPLTTNLREWRPSDILSLKRDVSYMYPKLRPTNDYYMFKNVFKPDLTHIKRRSIAGNVDSLENDISVGSYFNKIHKEGPLINDEKYDYKVRMVDNIDISDNSDNSNKSLKSELSKNNTEEKEREENTEEERWNENNDKEKEEDKEEITKIIPLQKYTVSDNSEKDFVNDVDNTTTEIVNITATEYSESTQNVSTEDNKEMFKSFVSNVSEFFADVGRQIAPYLSYIKQVVY